MMSSATTRLLGALSGAAVLVLGIAGFAKLLDLYAFRQSLESWKYIPAIVRPLMAASLPTGELLLALLWFLDFKRFRVEMICASLLAAMGGAALYHLMFSKPPNCNCFGIFSAYVAFLQDGKLLVWKSWVLAAVLIVSAVRWARTSRSPVPALNPESRTVRAASGGAPAFTLVELLIVIAIVAVLITLVMPSLRQVRSAAARTKTLSNLKSHANVLTVYGMDWSDAYPAFFPPKGGPFQLSGGGTTLDVPWYFMAAEYWQFSLTDSYYGVSPFDPVFYDAEASQIPEGGPALVMSCTFFARPEFWTDRRAPGVRQYGATYHYQVSLPAQKTLMFSELRLTGHSLQPNGGAASSLNLPVPMSFADGHAKAISASSVRSGVSDGEGNSPGGVHTFDALLGAHTFGGLSGFDIR